MGGRGKSKGKSGGGGSSSAPDNSAQIRAMQQQQEQQAQQAQAFAKQQADALAAQDRARKAEEEAARQQAIATQSANARSLATENQQEVGNKLKSTLSTPIQTGTMNYGAQASGFNPAAAKQTQAAQMGSAGTPAPMAAPGAAIAAKVNADSGGTNAVQNRFVAPNTSGLTFGGT